jgi:hypothetical protein
MAEGSRDHKPHYERSNSDTAAASVSHGGRHSGSIARAGGRPIDPLAVLHNIRATLTDGGGPGFDATAFVTVYGRTRGRPVIVQDASLARRGVLAETWICEACDVIRVDRQVPRRHRDMVILVQWAHIHYDIDPGGRAAAALFDVLAAAVAHHDALPTAPTRPHGMDME